jgi:hypothetical protein
MKSNGCRRITELFQHLGPAVHAVGVGRPKFDAFAKILRGVSPTSLLFRAG